MEFTSGLNSTPILLIAELFIYFKYKTACGGPTAKYYKASEDSSLKGKLGG